VTGRGEELAGGRAPGLPALPGCVVTNRDVRGEGSEMRRKVVTVEKVGLASVAWWRVLMSACARPRRGGAA